MIPSHLGVQTSPHIERPQQPRRYEPESLLCQWLSAALSSSPAKSVAAFLAWVGSLLGCAGDESLGEEVIGFRKVVRIAVDGPEVPDDPGVFGDVEGFVGVVLGWSVAEMGEVRELVVKKIMRMGGRTECRRG